MAKLDFKKIAMTVGTKVLGIGIGVAVGKGIDKVPFVGSLNGFIKGAAKIAVGALVVPMVTKKDSGLINDVGTGIAAVGVLDIAEKAMPSLFAASVSGMGYINGVGNAYIEEDHTPISGLSDDPYKAKVYGSQSAIV